MQQRPWPLLAAAGSSWCGGGGGGGGALEIWSRASELRCGAAVGALSPVAGSKSNSGTTDVKALRRRIASHTATWTPFRHRDPTSKKAQQTAPRCHLDGIRNRKYRDDGHFQHANRRLCKSCPVAAAVLSSADACMSFFRSFSFDMRLCCVTKHSFLIQCACCPWHRYWNRNCYGGRRTELCRRLPSAAAAAAKAAAAGSKFAVTDFRATSPSTRASRILLRSSHNRFPSVSQPQAE